MPTILMILLLMVPLRAEFTALLLDIEHNDLFHFSYEETAFSCEPAALVTLTKLYNQDRLNHYCKEEIGRFVKKYPYIPYQAKLLMHEAQKYMITPLGKKCLVMLNAGVSYSEYMIEKGYGMLPKVLIPDLQYQTLYEKLKLAQQRAQYDHRGVWENESLVNCFAQ